MRPLLWLVLLLLPLAAAQNETADPVDNGTESTPDGGPFIDEGTLRIANIAVAALLIGGFVYVARR